MAINSDEQDIIISGDDLDFDNAVMGKPRPAPRKPKPKGPTHPPRKPIKPISVSKEDIAASLAEQDKMIEAAKNERTIIDPRTGQEARVGYKRPAVPLSDPITITGRRPAMKPGRTVLSPKLKVPTAGEIGKEIGKGMVFGIPNVFLKAVSSTPEGIEEIGRTALRKLVPKWAPDPGPPALRSFTEYMHKEIEGAFPRPDPTLVEKVVGSGASFMIPGMAAAKLRMPMGLVSGGLGAAMNVSDISREMDKAGIDPARRDRAVALATATGLTEMAGLGKILKDFGLEQSFMKMFLRAGEEAGQEVLQGRLNNLNAALVGQWDPTRPLTKGIVEDALGGLIGAGVFGGASRFVKWDKQMKPTGEPPKPVGQAAAIPPPPGYVPPAPRQRPVPASMQSTRLAPGWDMVEMTKKEEPTSYSSEERQQNARTFVSKADSRLRLPSGDPINLYHGTSSPTEILQIDPSKFDPNALYGPGFYMTQNPEIAAGEEGGYSQKKSGVQRPVKVPGPFGDEIEVLEEFNAPHAYKLHANIERPFDIDAPVDTELQVKFRDSFGFFPRNYNGQEFYSALVEAVGQDKAAANQWLQEQGYDGITHIGGTRGWGIDLSKDRIYKTEEEARSDPAGGEVWQIDADTSKQAKDLDKIDITPGDWLVQGHRVWIAFNPEQVKSATGNIGTFDPTLGGISATKRQGFDNPSYKPSEDDFAFDVMPALSGKYGRAPYLRAPRWLFKAIGHEANAGVNIPFKLFHEYNERAWQNAPSIEHKIAARRAFNDLRKQAEAEGVDSLSIVNFQGSEEDVRGFIEHEVTHAGQNRVPIDPEWAINHPLVRDVFQRRNEVLGKAVGEQLFGAGEQDANLVHTRMAREMVTYWVEGRNAYLRMTNEEGRQFFKDYLNHVRSQHGQKGVDEFSSVIRANPRVLETIHESNIEWAEQTASVPFPYGTPSVMGVGPEAVGVEETRFRSFDRFKSKIKSWIDDFTKTGREVLEQNPPTPTIPEDIPIAEAPPPPRPPGRQPGGGAEGPFGPLTKEQVAPAYTQLLTRTFQRMLREGGLDVDPINPPFHQVVGALKNGDLWDVDIDAILREEGIGWEEFGTMLEETASDAGRTLQSFSEIAKFWNAILDEYEVTEGDDGGTPRGGKAGPRLPSTGEALLRIIPIDFRVRRALKGVRATALGKNFWQRAGNATQKAMLTQLSTFAVNTMTATGQLPIRMATQGIGAWMFQMMEGQGSLADRFRDGTDAAIEAMRASMEVIVGMNPWQLAQWAKGQANSTKFMEYWHIVEQIEKVDAFKDIHKKLFALSSGTETLKKGAKELGIAKALASQIPINHSKRTELLDEIQLYEDRLKANAEGIGKLLNKGEAIYDFFLQPMQIAEYFLRRPMFVGQLTLELKREGLDLATLMATNELHKIPPVSLERAVNRALEFTYAYMPGTKTGTNHKLERHIEKASLAAIDWLNKYGGPLNALIGEPFAKAMFNGAKFVYEYSPVGGILPGSKVVANLERRRVIREFQDAKASGALPANARMEMSGTRRDPTSGDQIIINETNQEDYDRIAKAMVGSGMYAIAALLMYAIGGEEWWQIDLGERDADGRPSYYDIRRLKPLSVIFQVVDFVDRLRDGTMGDMDFTKVATEIITGIRLFDNHMGGNVLDSTVDYFRNEPEPDWKTGMQRGGEETGKALAVYLTPLLNLRDLLAQFMEDENVKKDVRERTILGPAMDRIPFLRRLLPNLTSPVEPSPIELSVNPAISQLGIKKVKGENFAGREWGRLGIANKSFLPRDPDPVINRAQNQAFQEMVNQLGKNFESNPAYQQADDARKLMMWELFIAGDEGIASYAREVGAMANLPEAMKRSARDSSGMGRFTKKSLKLEETLNKIFPD